MGVYNDLRQYSWLCVLASMALSYGGYVTTAVRSKGMTYNQTQFLGSS